MAVLEALALSALGYVAERAFIVARKKTESKLADAVIKNFGSVRKKFVKETIRNEHLQRALRNAYRYACDILKDEYSNSFDYKRLPKQRRIIVDQFFKSLLQIDDVFPLKANETEIEVISDEDLRKLVSGYYEEAREMLAQKLNPFS